MSAKLLPFVLLACGSLSEAQQAPTEPSCAELFATKLRTDMALSMQQFDQSAEAGWRVLADRTCYIEAANLIQKYRAVNPAAHPIVRWHQAQMEAFAGHTAPAVENALATLRDTHEDAKSPFRWNPYVLGTVAFLRRDLKELNARRDELARAALLEPMNEPNAKALGRLASCFGQPYQQAYSCKR